MYLWTLCVLECDRVSVDTVLECDRVSVDTVCSRV